MRETLMLHTLKFHIWMRLEGPNKTSYSLTEVDRSTRCLRSSGKLRRVV